jgi:hypothetical protein
VNLPGYELADDDDQACGPWRPPGFDKGPIGNLLVMGSGQMLICLGVPPPAISILRGLALSAMGMRRVSTPVS